MRRLHAQLARFLTAEEDGNPAKNIGHMCADMKAQGYNYAMFTDKMEFDDAEASLVVAHKPGGWHFTELETWEEYNEDDTYGLKEGDTVPGMFNSVTYNNYRVSEFATQNIVFLKYTTPDPKVLRQIEDIAILQPRVSDKWPMHEFNWPQLQHAGYKGILVTNRERDMEAFGMWPWYPTLAIWDQSLLTPDKTSFHRNAGPFQYNE